MQFLPVEEEELAPPLMQPAKIEYKTEPAQRGTLIQQLRLSGSFSPKSNCRCRLKTRAAGSRRNTCASARKSRPAT
jgi:hypothetical protein